MRQWTRNSAFRATGTLVLLITGLGGAGCAAELASGRPASPGQTLTERTPAAGSPASDDPSARGGTRGYEVYTVRAGETLWRIASSHGTTVEALVRANSIANPKSLRAGMQLRIPVAKVATSTPRATPATGKAASRSSRITTRYPLRWPIEGSITSRYGNRAGRIHDGIDIGAGEGSSVHAAGDGKVIFAARHGAYGNLVIVQHQDGLVTIYAHHSANLVHKGERVLAGQTIAKVGTTGRASGPHLHFEVRKGVKPQNPLHFLPP